MHTSFKKMIHFTRLVKTDGRLKEFNYRKNNTAGEYVFDVDTADERGNRIFFRLTKQDAVWALTAKQALPDWITDIEQQLIAELENGLTTN